MTSVFLAILVASTLLVADGQYGRRRRVMSVRRGGVLGAAFDAVEMEDEVSMYLRCGFVISSPAFR